jgi:hypothetical protein
MSNHFSHEQIMAQPGWVEHDPAEIWECASTVARSRRCDDVGGSHRHRPRPRCRLAAHRRIPHELGTRTACTG